MPRRKQPTASATPPALASANGSAYAHELYKATSKDRRYVKRLRKLGASNYEIANALGIPEDAPVLHE